MHNEEGNVEQLYREVRGVLEKLDRPYEIIFVNDASADATLGAMKKIAGEDPCFHYADLETNVGENWALLAGVSKAQGEIIVTIDGDGQNDPGYIPELVEKLSGGYRVVSGWRQSRQGNLWLRRIPSLAANTLIRWVTGVPVHDCGCGLKAYRREVVAGKFVPKGFMNRFSPVVFGVKAHEFFEVPILDRTRSFGQSHYGISRVFVVLRDLWTIPFAIRGPAKWWPRFRRMQWTAWGAFVGLAIAGNHVLAAGALALGLMAYANATNLRRFVAAQVSPEFRIKEYR